MKEKDLWSLTLERMRKNAKISEVTIELWISKMNLEKLTSEKAYFSTHNDLMQDIISSKYSEYVKEELANVLGFEVEIVIVSCENMSFEEQISKLENKAKIEKVDEVIEMLDSNISEKPVVAERPNVLFSSSLPDFSPTYTFDNFVVGSSNTLAYNMAVSVCQKPALIANPLFLYGSPGLGKTHLMYAITNEMASIHPDFKIIYTKGEDFTNDLITSLTNKTPFLFREKYRNADVLLVDDIQFIAGKESIQEEFFHTYETLFEAGKQIIVTSDRLPKDIKSLAQRLRSRFEHGIIVDVQPPDLELRVAIFKKKAEALGMEVPNDVLMYLGDNIKDNIRQIEGALKKMRAIAYIQGSNVTMEHAKDAVKDIQSSKAEKITPERIINYVSQKYQVQYEDILGKRKTDTIALARQISMFLLRELTDLSHSNVGKAFNRDHATVVSAVNKIKAKIKSDSSFEAQIDDMISDLKNSIDF